MLDDDDEPIKDVIATGPRSFVERNKNPLSEYTFRIQVIQTYTMRLSVTFRPDDE